MQVFGRQPDRFGVGGAQRSDLTGRESGRCILERTTPDLLRDRILGGELAPGSGLFRSLYLAAGVIPGAQVGAIISRRVHGPWLLRLLVSRRQR